MFDHFGKKADDFEIHALRLRYQSACQSTTMRPASGSASST
jgi:hypothetical protein